MFTLGNKLRVLNAEAEVVVKDAAGAARTTSAAMTASDVISIEGFGTFKISDITDMKMFRAVTPVAESKDYTCVAPAGIAIGDAIEVLVFLKTSRYQSELKNNFIGAAHPVKFSTKPLTAVTTTAIRTAIVDAWADWKLQFHNTEATINVTAGAAATSIKVDAGKGYESVNITKVELKRVQSGIGTQVPVKLAVAATNAVGNEGLGTGKFLEESVRMATGINSRPYGSDNASTIVDVRGEYTEVSLEIVALYDENLSTLAADHGPLAANHRFTVYMNEATMIAADAAIAKMSAAAILAAAANAGSTATIQAAPLTRAQEETESLIIENGNSVDTVAAFIA